MTAVSLPGKREFLSKHTNPATGLPYAKFPSQGRMSADAHAFAEANRDKWSEAPAPAPATPRPAVAAAPRTPAAPRPERVAVDKNQTKIIRQWAKAQDGLKVGDRGVLPPDVIAAYKSAHGDLPAGGSTTSSVTVARRPSPLDMPRRTNIIGLAIKDGITHVQDRCGKCPSSVQNCNCPGGPQATGGVTGPLVLV